MVSRAILDDATATIEAGCFDLDDCAVISIDGPCDVVLGTDYVRGVKFDLYELGLLSDFDVGFYLAAANLSDIAAMGAQPVGILSVVRYPHDMSDAAFTEVLLGIRQACAEHSTAVLGGDIGSAERLITSASACGIVESGRALRRSAAVPGDGIFVTGPTGTAGAAVLAFGQPLHLDRTLVDELLQPWRRPKARILEGRLLVMKRLSRCAQDTSDGLKATLEQIAASSNVGMALDFTQFPIPPAVRTVASAVSVDPLALALSASVDFELVFTVNANTIPATEEAFHAAQLRPPIRLGTVTAEPTISVRTSGDAQLAAIPGVTWTHQRGPVSETVRIALSADSRI